MMSVKSVFATALSTFIALVFAGAALSQTPPKEGKYDATTCSASAPTNSIAFSATHSASSWEITGMNLSTPPGGLFDKTTFRCVGLSSMLDGKNSAKYVCELVDADGSKLLSYWTNEDGKATRTNVVGTGKFEGIELTTTSESFGVFSKIKPGTFQACGRNTGTYKLK